MTAVASVYDGIAARFEAQRALPDGVARSIRGAVLRACAPAVRPLLLDLGAGTGRIGWPFVAERDDYIGLDLSFGMLDRFSRRGAARLVQGDGAALPFPDGCFDAVMLVQVFSAAPRWQGLVSEARRVLRPGGVLATGRTIAPEGFPQGGIDERMKQELDRIVEDLGLPPYRTRSGDQALRWLEQAALRTSIQEAGRWIERRSPLGFIERHAMGARFSTLDEPVRRIAMDRLASWARATFGSLETVSEETFTFRLHFFHFQQGTTPQCPTQSETPC